MFEYHAWITIHSSPGGEEGDALKEAFDAAAREVRPLQGGTTEIDLRWVNGTAHLHMSGFLNHRSGEGQEVIDAFERVVKVAPGSYGVLYIRDDEDLSGQENEFQMIVMRRGTTFAATDSLLSPCVPVIEDE